MNVDRHLKQRGAVGSRRASRRRVFTASLAAVLGAVGLVAPQAGVAQGAAAQTPAPGQAAAQVAATGTPRTARSADGRLTMTVTPSQSTMALPINGVSVTFTYRVTNTTALPAYYRGLTDTLCHTPGVDPQDSHGGLKTDGVRWWIPAKSTGTFSCQVLITQAKAGAATATFDTSVRSTAAPTASIVTVRTPVAMAARPCNTLWYSSTSRPLGAPVPASPGTIGRVDLRKGKKAFTPVFRIGDLAGGTAGQGSAAFAVDASRPNSAYFVGDSAGVSRGLFHLDLTTGKTTKVTGTSPATSTLRLAADRAGRVWSWAQNGHLYSLDPGSSTWTERRFASITDVDGKSLDVSTFQAGDIAIGGNGGLWMLAGDQVTRRMYLLTIPGTAIASEDTAKPLDVTVIGQVSSPQNGGYDNGTDFGADGYLYSTTGPNAVGDGSVEGLNYLYRLDPATGHRTLVGSMPTKDVGSVADLGSCALPRSELAVTTTASTETGAVSTGDRITYTVRISSVASQASARVRLADVLPAHTRYVPRSTTLNGVAVADIGGAMPYSVRDAEGNGRTEVHSPGALRGVIGGGKTAVVRYTVQVGDIKGVDELTHQPVVSEKARTFVSDDPSLPGSADATRTLVARPRVQITQSVDTATVTGSGMATYLAVVRNIGTEPLAGISLDGSTTTSDGATTRPISDDTCTRPTLRPSSDADGNGLLDVGEAWVYACTQPIRWGPGDADAWTVSRNVTTRAAGGVSSDVVDATTSPVQTTVGYAPAAIDVTTEAGRVVGPDSATGRLEATYTVHVKNTGQKDTSFSTPTFRPAFARGLKVISARYTTPGAPKTVRQATFAADGSFVLGDGDAVTSLAAGQQKDFRIAVALVSTSTVAPAACNGTVGHGLYAQADLPTGEEKGSRRNNAACITPPAPPAPRVGLVQTSGGVVDADGDGLIRAGDTVTHSFVVTNLSRTLTLSNIRVEAPLVGQVTCAASTLAIGGRTTCSSAPYRLTAADIARGSVTSSARVVATPPNLAARTARASTTTRVPTSTGARAGIGTATGTSSLSVKRSVAIADTARDGIAGAGDLATHTFTVTNTGTSTVRSVVVDAPGLGVLGTSCTNRDVRPRARVTCRVVAPLGQKAVDASMLRDTATVTARQAGRLVTARQTTRLDLTRTTPAVRNAIRLTTLPGGIVDANSTGAIDPGDLIRYAFDVRNTGTQNLSLLQVRDPKLPEVLSVTAGTCARSTLAPGETTTCLPRNGHIITAADMRAGSFANAPVAVARDPHGKLVSSPVSPARKTLPLTPKIVLDAVPDSLTDVTGTRPGDSAGDLLSYHMLVRNVGGVPVSDIRLTDPALGLEDSPCSTGIAGEAAPLLPGQIRRCGVSTRYVVAQSDVERRKVVRTSKVTVAGPDGKDHTVASKPAVTTLTPRPGMTLAVSHTAPARPRVGDKIGYRYTVTNTGAGTLSSVRIIDPRVGIDAPCTTAQATLAPSGATKRVTCTVKGTHTVTREDVAGGRVQNDVEVVAAAGLGVVRTRATDVVATVAPAAAVRLTAAGADVLDRNKDGRTGAGDGIEQRFTVTNTGDLPMSVTSLTDPVLNRAGTACPTLTFAPGQSVTCSLTRTLTAADLRAGKLTTTTTVRAHAGRRAVAVKATGTLHLSAQAPLGVRQKATIVDSNGNGYLDAGERATFTVTVTHTTNRTPRPATFAKVIVDAPAFVGNAPVCALPKGGLKPGKSVTCTPLTWRTTPQDEDAGAVRHTVQARAVLAGGVRTPDSARVKSVVRTTPAAPGIGLRALTTLRDTDRDGAADAGESVRYTFLVSNTGTTAVRRPTLAVTLSSGRRLAVTCPDEALDPGTNVACVTTVKLTAQDVRASTLIVKGVATVIDVNGTTLRSPASTSPIRSSVTH